MKHVASLLLAGLALGALALTFTPSIFWMGAAGAASVHGDPPTVDSLGTVHGAGEAGPSTLFDDVEEIRIDGAAVAEPRLDGRHSAARVPGAAPDPSEVNAEEEDAWLDEYLASPGSRLEVHVTGHVPPGLAAVALSTLDEDHHDFFVAEVIEGFAALDLKDGPYLVFLEVEGRAASAFESVHAGRKPQRIEMRLAEPVAITGLVEDGDGPLPGVEVFVGPFTEDKSALAKTLDRGAAVRTGSDGRFEITGLQPAARYQLRVEDDRFVRHSQEFDVGAESLDIGKILLRKGHRIEVQIEGWADWGQPEDFEISTREIHDRKVRFDSTGRASLSCDRLGSDFLNLWYPGEPTVMSNIEVDVRDAMEPVRITVGDARDLTIGLAHSDEIEEILRGPLEFFLSVNYRTSSGSWYSLNLEVDGFRDYHAFGIDSEEVTVRLVLADNNMPFEWTSCRVSFEGARSLRVDFEDVAPPKTLHVGIDADTPLAGGVSLLRRRHDPTDWYTSDRLDEAGRRGVPGAVTGDVAMTYWKEDSSLLCIDVPVATGPKGELPAAVFIGPLLDVEVEVQDAGVAIPSAWFSLASLEDPTEVHWRQTGASGEPSRFPMANGTRCEMRADVEAVYPVDRPLRLEAGHHVLEVRRFGALRLPPGVLLSEVRNVEFGRTLEDWRSEPWFRLDAPDGTTGAKHLPRLPRGEYRHSIGRSPNGEETSVSTRILAGETVDLMR
ncbi:hypothetical protein Poly30_00390 [Planctomycetes bacterium Poly30]|uniref:Carboxypeptidase regulatory-like domain-containing protein n=1 Tax=Saltatorellus ferox TaxID=2528018 RepID=A0A518EKD4_9BACT|nr:hypothetical protein Poly30_00390 [Planctomycetes bacterium Poly30]